MLYSFIVLSVFCLTSLRGYNFYLQNQWQGSNFFDGWDFFDSSDPTHGFVQYVSQEQAISLGLIKTTSTQAWMMADSQNVAPDGRYSVRISTQQSYNQGLFILDLEHMPQGCATWPAWWTCGPDWPNYGEIDIIEGVNLGDVDASTLHTDDGCDYDGVWLNMTGTWAGNADGGASDNCYVNAPDEYSNQGCSVESVSGSFGESFNNNGGGVYAVLWDPNESIRIWWWPRYSIPSNVESNNPEPSQWGIPVAEFSFGSWCPSSHFQNHNIIFDLTFCGDWAGSVWSSSGCQTMDSSCDDFVANNPSYFAEAYWLVNYVKVFNW